jgi:hypothetical protein
VEPVVCGGVHDGSFAARDPAQTLSETGGAASRTLLEPAVAALSKR